MKFSPVFTDHAVLAAHAPIRIYGEGEGVATVSLASHTLEAAAKDGRWSVEFPPMEYGGPYELVLEADGERTLLEDIYVGEVYLFSGQSNMQFKLKESNTPTEEYESIGFLRYFSAERPEAGDRFTPANGWVVSRADEVGDWSAIAYLAARKLARRKGIAVGAICCAQGASVIESWMPRGTLSARGIVVAPEHKYIDHTHERYGRWNGDGYLYETMLSQVTPYSLNGVVWYQGESDVSVEEGAVYADELRAMIDVWRDDFCDRDLPFVIVQIADHISKNPRPGWTLVQAAQTEVGEGDARAETVICRDVCEKEMIHPVSKTVLSERIADALARLVK